MADSSSNLPKCGLLCHADAAEAQPLLDPAQPDHDDMVVPMDAIELESSDYGDTELDDADQDEIGSQDLPLSEANIITVMEFASLPRHEAINLLLNNGGDPNAVLAALYDP